MGKKTRRQWWQRLYDPETPKPKPSRITAQNWPAGPTSKAKAAISTRVKRSQTQRKVKTAADAEAIKRRYLAGETLRQIGGDLGIDPQTVLNVLKRLGVPRRKAAKPVKRER